MASHTWTTAGKAIEMSVLQAASTSEMLKEVDVAILIIISLRKFSSPLAMHLDTLITYSQRGTAVSIFSSYETRILMAKGQILTERWI